MKIIGCDYHPGFQQIAYVDTDTGEFNERRLAHREEAEQFYRELAAREGGVRVGMEASGQARWFERLLGELQFELWIGDAAEIRTKRVRKQKTDRQSESRPAVADSPSHRLHCQIDREISLLLGHRSLSPESLLSPTVAVFDSQLSESTLE